MSIGHHSAVRATFEDVKRVKTRKCWQLIFEVPEEAYDAAIATLGGSPQSGTDRWVGIAPITAPEGPAETERPKGGPICKRAVMLCKNEPFTMWLAEQWRDQWDWTLKHHNGDTEHVAKHTLYLLCNIKSRAELDHDVDAAAKFERIQRDFYRSLRGETEADLRTQAMRGP